MILKIRSATDEDCRLLWEWVNDPEVRALAFESNPITWEAHIAWFRRKRFGENSYMYVVMDQDDCPIGQVRFDVQADGRAETDISIAREQCGRGYGVEALRIACAHLFRTAPVRWIVAHMKPDNAASIRAFEKAGFVHQGRESTKGVDAVKLMLVRPSG